MIPVLCAPRHAALALLGLAAAVAATATAAANATAAATADDRPGGAPGAAHCLPSGDGYLRARLGGSIEAHIDWANAGTRCEGESKSTPAGVRLSFQRDPATDSPLLFVFGLTGVREGRPAREVGANLTLIVQGTDRIYGTLGDTRCTVDSLTQRRLGDSHSYRVEARGFCTQPAHAVRGDGAVLVSTFEFAGLVDYDAPSAGSPSDAIPHAPTPAK